MGEDTELGETSDHQVYLDSYWIGKYPVTVGQWKLIMKSTIYTDRNFNNDKQIPIVDITWNEIENFMKNLNKIINLGFSLPTEAEWEKGARGSDGRKYPWGNMEPDNKLCNFDGFFSNKPTQVNKYPKGISPYGLKWTEKEFPTPGVTPPRRYRISMVIGGHSIVLYRGIDIGGHSIVFTPIDYRNTLSIITSIQNNEPSIIKLPVL